MNPESTQAAFSQAGRDSMLILPEIMLALFGLAILLTDRFLPPVRKHWHSYTALLGLAFSAASLAVIAAALPPGITAFSQSILIDPFFIYFGWLCLAVATLVVLLPARSSDPVLRSRGEMPALLLFGTLGMMFLACGNNLIVLFVALEILASSVAVRNLWPAHGQARRGNIEAAVKYGIISALGSAILLYGFSLLYGLAGSTNLTGIARKIAGSGAGSPLAFTALAAIWTGVFVHLGAVPFHHWQPDSSEAAPGPAAAFASVGARIGAFALLLRLCVTAFWPLRSVLVEILLIVGVLSVLLGALASLTQSNLKRLLAYLLIAQAGYILLGWAAAAGSGGSFSNRGAQATAYYLFVFAFFAAGAFALVTLTGRTAGSAATLDDLRGFAAAHPGIALLLLIFLLSFAGVPPTAGFMAAWFVIWSLVAAGHGSLALVVGACLPLTLYSVLRVVRSMWKPAVASGAGWRASSWLERCALAAAAAVVLGAGIFPERLLHFAQYSMMSALGR